MKKGKSKHAIAPDPAARGVGSAATKFDLYTFEQDDDDDDSTAASGGSEQLGDTKMYADEASLYSIAEDSREDAISTVVGRTEEGVLMSTAAETGSGEQHPGEFGVELSLDEEDEDAVGLKDGDDDSAVQFYDLDRRRRRRFIATTAILIFIVLALVAIAVSVTQSQEETSRNAVSEGILAGETEEEPPDPTDAPTFADTTRIQAETLVALAIGDCPGSGSYSEETTPQGQVFQALIDEVEAKATFDPTTGDVTFDELHGIDYLREKYALGMLYFATEGNADSWQVDDQWMTGTDPCESWTGIVCDSPRSGGSCAVTSLELGEFCCWEVRLTRVLHTQKLERKLTHVFPSSTSFLFQIPTTCVAIFRESSAVCRASNILGWQITKLLGTF